METREEEMKLNKELSKLDKKTQSLIKGYLYLVWIIAGSLIITCVAFGVQIMREMF